MRSRSRCLSFAVALLSAVSTSGCAMLETRRTKLQAVKTIGIISAVGDEFTFEKGGLTGLNDLSLSGVEGRHTWASWAKAAGNRRQARWRA